MGITETLVRLRRVSSIAILLAATASTAIAADDIEKAARDVLTRCDAIRAEARARARRNPNDGHAHLRIAISEMRRANLLALISYEAGGSQSDFDAWRARYLQTDPDGAICRAATAARAATRRRLTPARRRHAYLILAATQRDLGNPRAEAEAVAAAARHQPNDATLWARLADAYARARLFTRSHAAMARAQRLL